jgi:hypothetical protein
MSKGSKPRPMTVSRDVFDSNWDLIFCKPKKKISKKKLNLIDKCLDSFFGKKSN